MKKIKKPLRYFMYARKSTEGEERQVLSIPAQRKRILERFPHIIIVEILEERGSAFKPGRPIFNEILARIDAGEADGFVAWHPDRLSRNEIDSANITFRLRDGIIKDLLFVSFPFSNTPEGIMMLQQVFASSQYFSSKLSIEVKKSMTLKADNGWYPGAAPAGYLNAVQNRKGIIVKDPERFPLLQMAWRMLLGGSHSVPEILEYLNNKCAYRTIQRIKVGGKPLSRSALYYIFANPFYGGLVEYDGRTYNGKHDTMITMEEFDHAQRILGRKGKPRLQKHEHAYTGLIRCGECGCQITAITKTKYYKGTNNYRTYTYYHCTRRKVGHPCKQQSITVAQLESQINALLEKLEIIPDFEQWALDAIRSQNEREHIERTAIRNNIESELRKAEERSDELVDMRCKKLMTDEEFTWHRNRLEKQLVELEQQRDEVDHRFNSWKENAQRAISFSARAVHAFQNGDKKVKRTIVRTLGTEFILKDKKLAVKPMPWFKILMDDGEPENGENGTLEPLNPLTTKGQSTNAGGCCPRWSGKLDALRTSLRNSKSPIFIPDLTNLDSQESPPPSNSRHVE